MVAISDNTVEQVVDAIVQSVAPERVYLFGSRARGTADGNSDLDLLVIERRPFGAGTERWDEVRRIRNALDGFRVPVDILVFSEDEFSRWSQTTNHVVARAVREGRLLYERS